MKTFRAFRLLLLAGCAKRGSDGEESRALVADGGGDVHVPVEAHLCLTRTTWRSWLIDSSNEPGSEIVARLLTCLTLVGIV